MKTKDIARRIKDEIYFKGIEEKELGIDLDLSNDQMKRYLSGKGDLTDLAYLRLLEHLKISIYEVGYENPKAEKPLNNTLKYLAPSKKALEIVFKGFLYQVKTVFKKRQPGEVKKVLTNDLFFEKVSHEPFLYKYTFMSILFLILLDYVFSNVVVLSALFSSLLIPFVMLIFLFELDRSDLSLFGVLKFFLVGGIVSLGLTHLIREVTGFTDGILGDLQTGFVEETAKLLVVLIILKRVKVKHMFTGVLIGFAVGAGFDVFETTDYAINTLIETSGNYNEMIWTTWFRSIFAVGIGHHFWTGILAGTLVSLSTSLKVAFKKLYHLGFIGMYLLIILVHASWNFNPYVLGQILQVVFGLLFFVIFTSNAYIKMLDVSPSVESVEVAKPTEFVS
ncbi:MAG TPA: PrsW family glutamic-type intramembrane protease [Acholeplasma sp.]|nr:PrsW family glutamic-type intramembrane protease [Acholeplasma sp.]